MALGHIPLQCTRDEIFQEGFGVDVRFVRQLGIFENSRTDITVVGRFHIAVAFPWGPHESGKAVELDIGIHLQVLETLDSDFQGGKGRVVRPRGDEAAVNQGVR